MVCLLRLCSRRQLRIQDADNRRHTRKANGPRFVLAHDFTGWPVDRIHLFWPGAERHGHILLRVAAAQNSCSSCYRQFLLYVVYRQSLSGIRGCSGASSQFLESSCLRRGRKADHALQLTGTDQRLCIVPGRSRARDPPRNREQRRRSLQQPQIDLTCLTKSCQLNRSMQHHLICPLRPFGPRKPMKNHARRPRLFKPLSLVFRAS